MYKTEIDQYCHEIRKHLSCSKKAEKLFLQQTRQMIDEFFADRPTASFSDVKDFLGEAEDVAESFMESMEQEEVITSNKRQRKKWAIILVTLGLVITLLGCWLALVLNHVREPITVTRVINYGEKK